MSTAGYRQAGGRCYDREGARVQRAQRGFQNEASSVREDLEASVCVLEKQQVTLLAWKVQTFNKEVQGR